MPSQFIVVARRLRAVPFIAMAGLLAVALGLTGCGSAKRDPFAGIGSPMYPGNGPLPKGGGRYVVGEPYQVAGEWFTPREEPSYDKVGIASWYGPQFHRRMTSNGEWFDMAYLSAAHPTLPLPSYARITNLENGREVIVRINDRGPFVGNRIIDLSKASAEKLGFAGKGTAKVRVRYIGPAPLDDKGTHLLAMNETLKRSDSGSALAQASMRQPQPIIQATSDRAGGGIFVQVGAFSDPANVTRARQRLAGVGPVQVIPVNGLYRVRLGPLTGVDDAEYALQQVRAAGHRDARLVQAQE
jgi:rare lipoprotein A